MVLPDEEGDRRTISESQQSGHANNDPCMCKKSVVLEESHERLISDVVESFLEDLDLESVEFKEKFGDTPGKCVQALSSSIH
jgi:hypothetical protein